MPTYQYACTECGHAFEQFQSFTDDALTECPQCQGRLRKLFNAVGVVFKGSGFYRNDSRATGQAQAATAPPAPPRAPRPAPASRRSGSPRRPRDEGVRGLDEGVGRLGLGLELGRLDVHRRPAS